MVNHAKAKNLNTKKQTSRYVLRCQK